MPVQCTEAEWKILTVLWEESPRTMRQITDALAPATGWTRHTVITLLKRMEEKGTVAVDASGEVKTYRPRVSRETAAADETRRFVSHVFSGKASLLVSHLIDSGEITVKEMEEILQMLKKEGE